MTELKKTVEAPLHFNKAQISMTENNLVIILQVICYETQQSPWVSK